MDNGTQNHPLWSINATIIKHLNIFLSFDIKTTTPNSKQCNIIEINTYICI